MKNLRSLHKREGFTLIEIVLAMAIFGTVATAILGLLGTSLNYASRTYNVVNTVFYVKNLFFEPESIQAFQQDTKKVIEKKIKEPSLNLTFALQEFKSKHLAKKFENCYLAKAASQGAFELDMFGIVCIQKEEKEK